MKKLTLLSLFTTGVISLFAAGTDSTPTTGGFTSLTQQAVNLGGFVNTFNGKVVAAVGVLLMSLAVVTFFAGTVRFIWSMKEGKGEKAEEGKKFMLWGLIGIFVIFSVYGIIFFFQQTLGVGGFVNLNKPCTDFVNDCKNGTGSGLTPTKPTVGGGGGGDGYGGGTVGTSAGVSAAGMKACQNMGGAVGIDLKCYQSATGQPCFQGCQIANGRVINPGEVYTPSQSEKSGCAKISGHVGEDGKCYQNTSGMPCYNGCTITNGKVDMPSGGSGGYGGGSVSWLAEATIICNTENGTMGEDNRCYTNITGSRCFKGCDILGGRLVSPIEGANPPSIDPSAYSACDLIQGTVGEDGKCYQNTSGLPCYRGCTITNGVVDTPDVSSSSCSGVNHKVGSVCKTSTGKPGTCYQDYEGVLYCQEGGDTIPGPTPVETTYSTCDDINDLGKTCQKNGGGSGHCAYDAAGEYGPVSYCE